MPDEPDRFLCGVRLESKGITLFTCGRCIWNQVYAEGEDMHSAQAAFDAHRCEDFPAPPIRVLSAEQA